MRVWNYDCNDQMTNPRYYYFWFAIYFLFVHRLQYCHIFTKPLLDVHLGRGCIEETLIVNKVSKKYQING